MGYIDSHTHITNEEYDLALYKEEIEEAKALGQEKALMVLAEAEERKFISDFKDDAFFDFATGLFPTIADKVSDDDLKILYEDLKNNPYIALGEIGLDYHWAKEIKEAQKELFIKQIKIANELNLPVIIHSREAMKDTYDILKEYDVKRKGIIHCFSGSKEMAQEFIKLGFYIALGGTITYKNNKNGIMTLSELPLERLLIETDAPYLTPVPYRGKRNKTSNVILVYKFISDFLNIDEDILIDITKANYYRLLYENK